ncbi:MAG: hypothetical protein HY606_07305 [Planctomycetes bacterium]|nr:hypothetical protein [Planctomycetota bacterium]
MKVISIINLILFSIFPVVTFVCYILKEYEIFVISWSAGLLIKSAVIIFIFWLLLALIIRSRDRAALITCAAILLAYSINHFYIFVKGFSLFGLVIGKYRYVAGVFFIILLLSVIYILKRSVLDNINKLFRVIGTALVITPVVFTSFHFLNFEKVKLDGGSKEVQKTFVTGKNLPDIYCIIVDACARSDVLKQSYSFDNSQFLNYLRSSGFYIAEQSRTNYSWTIPTISAMLNLNYLSSMNADRRSAALKLARMSKVTSMLNLLGYKIIQYSDCDLRLVFDNIDIYAGPDWYGNPIEIRFLTSVTPVEAILAGLGIGFSADAPKRHLVYALESMGRKEFTYRPQFVFAHLLGLHGPFLLTGKNNPANFKNDYVSELVQTNEYLKRVIDSLMSDKLNPPIIVIISDHGPHNVVDELYFSNDTSDEFLFERMSNFSAFYLPNGGNSLLYNTITPVNIFRIIFNFYFGANYELLPDRCYYSTYKERYLFRDVTDITNR